MHARGCPVCVAQTSFEAKEAEWQKADLAMNKGGAEGPGGLDNWMAKQANN